jgi:hypothetical protein
MIITLLFIMLFVFVAFFMTGVIRNKWFCVSPMQTKGSCDLSHSKKYMQGNYCRRCGKALSPAHS